MLLGFRLPGMSDMPGVLEPNDVIPCGRDEPRPCFRLWLLLSLSLLFDILHSAILLAHNVELGVRRNPHKPIVSARTWRGGSCQSYVVFAIFALFAATSCLPAIARPRVQNRQDFLAIVIDPEDGETHREP
jgi:hypothetical protein